MSKRYVIFFHAKKVFYIDLKINCSFQINEEEHEYVWLGHSFEETKEILLDILRQPEGKIKSADVLWNICVDVLASLLLSNGQRRYLQLIHNENYPMGEKRRFLVIGAILVGMGLAKKSDEYFGGLVYNGPNVFPKYCQHLKEEYDVADVKLVLRPVPVKEEHMYTTRPPQFESIRSGRLAPEEEKERSIKNQNTFCRCGFEKKIQGGAVIHREGHKTHIRKKVTVGQKRRTRCKLCENCLRPPCRKCDFCLKPHLKKPCVLRECLFPVVPKCPCFD